MMDCKKALSECDGDMDNAVDFLRKKGLATAQKRAGRAMTEGTIQSYIHMGGKLGVLVEVNCETDFVSGNKIGFAVHLNQRSHRAVGVRIRLDQPFAGLALCLFGRCGQPLFTQKGDGLFQVTLGGL